MTFLSLFKMSILNHFFVFILDKGIYNYTCIKSNYILLKGLIILLGVDFHCIKINKNKDIAYKIFSL